MTITATTWVPRGFAAEHPVRYEMTDEDLEKLNQLSQMQLDDAKGDLEGAKQEEAADSKLKDAEEVDEDLKEYNLENYDEEEDASGQLMGMFGNAKSLQYHEKDDGDAYLTMPNEDEEKEEREDLQILPTDNLILSTKTEDDISCLEVYVYNDEEEQTEDGVFSRNDLYVHHDFMLPSEPLCVEWLDYRVGSSDEKPGNFAAIGTFEPTIEVWDLDQVDSVFPKMVLGVEEQAAQNSVKKGRKKKHNKQINDKTHVDAVLSLSANKLHRNILASASADTTVKLWDLTNGSCAKSFTYHDDKVSAVAWNPSESTVLLSGGYDHQAIVADVRVESSKGQRKWKVDGDVEGLQWGDAQTFYVASENGRLHKFDARMEGKSVWTLQAHDSDITSFDVSPHIDGFMATASTDKTVKLWNIQDNKPSMILSRDLDIGKIFSVRFNPDPENAGHVSAGGTQGSVKVWDTFTNRFVRESVGSSMAKLVQARQNRKETIASVVLNDSEGSDDEFEDVDEMDDDE